MTDPTLNGSFPDLRSNLLDRHTPSTVYDMRSRRSKLGSRALARPTSAEALYQPQDGAPKAAESAVRVQTISGPSAGTESQDARLTGSLRSLSRRVLGLNVMAAPIATTVELTETYFSEPHLGRVVERVAVERVAVERVAVERARKNSDGSRLRKVLPQVA